MPVQTVSPTVLVASDDSSLLDEIVRHLEEIPNWKLVTSAGSSSSMLAALESHLPDAVIISDGLARELARRTRPSGLGTLVVVGRQESAPSLKAALKLGARGFVAWPSQARQLRSFVETDSAGSAVRDSVLGALHAVWAPKGGSGASVIAAHLAWCVAAKAPDGCLLVDLDVEHGDQTAILGAENPQQGLADLMRMADEFSRSIVDSVAWEHPGGFRAILSAGATGEGDLVKGREVARVVSLIRETTEHVITDLPSGVNEVALSVLEEASRIILVVTPDLLCLRRAQQAMKTLRTTGLDESLICLVINQSTASGVSKKDVGAILGLDVHAQLKADASLYQAANRGQLSPTGRKMLTKLAGQLTEAGEPKTASGLRSRTGTLN
ncbi:MAG: hypothetical protein ACR2FO_07775 [Actinomycetota bacterium]